MTRDLEGVTASLERELGLAPGFRDDGVGAFGLENRVLAAGDCFVEVLTPLRADSAGQRYLERRGSDGGYMAIFQLSDRSAALSQAAEAETRVVWHLDLDDISGTHLDPRDVTGAIVSLDWADPPESWRWAGPSWQGGSPPGLIPGGITSLVVAVGDPHASARRWAAALGPGAQLDSTVIRLQEAEQLISFVAEEDRAHQGIVSCGIALEGAAGPRDVEIANVTFHLVPARPTTDEETQ